MNRERVCGFGHGVYFTTEEKGVYLRDCVDHVTTAHTVIRSLCNSLQILWPLRKQRRFCHCRTQLERRSTNRRHGFVQTVALRFLPQLSKTPFPISPLLSCRRAAASFRSTITELRLRGGVVPYGAGITSTARCYGEDEIAKLVDCVHFPGRHDARKSLL